MIAELLELVKQNKPQPIYEVYEIAKEWGHTVTFTPPYCHQSQPIEIVWANIKNLIGKSEGACTIPDLMACLQAAKDKLQESTMLGAYADTRQWEDEMWLADQDVDGIDSELLTEPDDDCGDEEDDAVEPEPEEGEDEEAAEDAEEDL